MLYKKETHLVKIKIPNNANSTFNTREKHLNIEIQKCIDSYNNRGIMVIEKNIINKTAEHANVKFTTQKLIK